MKKCVDKKENKMVYFARAIVYKDMSHFIGKRFNLMKLVHEKYKMTITAPVTNIEHVYGCVYKIETAEEVYITYVVERTVE